MCHTLFRGQIDIAHEYRLLDMEQISPSQSPHYRKQGSFTDDELLGRVEAMNEKPRKAT